MSERCGQCDTLLVAAVLFMYVMYRGDTGSPESSKDIIQPLINRRHQEIRSMLNNICAIRLIFIVRAQELPKFGRLRVIEAEAIDIFTPETDGVITLNVWNVAMSALLSLF